jgi:hypothetical protein
VQPKYAFVGEPVEDFILHNIATCTTPKKVMKYVTGINIIVSIPNVKQVLDFL